MGPNLESEQIRYKFDSDSDDSDYEYELIQINRAVRGFFQTSSANSYHEYF
jgi:hypothetical protein